MLIAAKTYHHTNFWYLTQNNFVGLAKLTHKINNFGFIEANRCVKFKSNLYT